MEPRILEENFNLDEIMRSLVSDQLAVNRKMQALEITPLKLVLFGKTGAGKTTLSNHLVGANLRITEKPDGTIHVEGGEGIGAGFASETTLPNFFIGNQVAVIDCPGTGDVRGPTQQVKNAFYIQTIFNGLNGQHKLRNFLFLLVVRDHDLTISREGLRGSMCDLINLIGTFTDEMDKRILLVPTGCPRNKAEVKIGLEALYANVPHQDMCFRNILENIIDHESIIIFPEPDRHQIGLFYTPGTRSEIFDWTRNRAFIPELNANIVLHDKARIGIIELSNKLKENVQRAEIGYIKSLHETQYKSYNQEIPLQEFEKNIEKKTEEVNHSDVLLDSINDNHQILIWKELCDRHLRISDNLEKALVDLNKKVRKFEARERQTFNPPLSAATIFDMNKGVARTVFSVNNHLEFLVLPTNNFFMTNRVGNQDYGYIRHKVAGDRDCGYTSLGITRQDAVMLLLRNIEKISYIIEIPVKHALLTTGFYDYLWNEKIIKEPHKNIIKNSELERCSKILAVQMAYIKYDVKHKNIDAGYSHPAVLQALARIQNFEIHIWRLGENDVLVPHDTAEGNYVVMELLEYPPQEANERVDLLFVNNNHFERLEFIGYEGNIPENGIYPLTSPSLNNSKTIEQVLADINQLKNCADIERTIGFIQTLHYDELINVTQECITAVLARKKQLISFLLKLCNKTNNQFFDQIQQSAAAILRRSIRDFEQTVDDYNQLRSFKRKIVVLHQARGQSPVQICRNFLKFISEDLTQIFTEIFPARQEIIQVLSSNYTENIRNIVDILGGDYANLIDHAMPHSDYLVEFLKSIEDLIHVFVEKLEALLSEKLTNTKNQIKSLALSIRQIYVRLSEAHVSDENIMTTIEKLKTYFEFFKEIQRENDTANKFRNNVILRLKGVDNNINEQKIDSSKGLISLGKILLLLDKLFDEIRDAAEEIDRCRNLVHETFRPVIRLVAGGEVGDNVIDIPDIQEAYHDLLSASPVEQYRDIKNRYLQHLKTRLQEKDVQFLDHMPSANDISNTEWKQTLLSLITSHRYLNFENSSEAIREFINAPRENRAIQNQADWTRANSWLEGYERDYNTLVNFTNHHFKFFKMNLTRDVNFYIEGNPTLNSLSDDDKNDIKMGRLVVFEKRYGIWYMCCSLSDRILVAKGRTDARVSTYATTHLCFLKITNVNHVNSITDCQANVRQTNTQLLNVYHSSLSNDVVVPNASFQTIGYQLIFHLTDYVRALEQNIFTEFQHKRAEILSILNGVTGFWREVIDREAISNPTGIYRLLHALKDTVNGTNYHATDLRGIFNRFSDHLNQCSTRLNISLTLLATASDLYQALKVFAKRNQGVLLNCTGIDYDYHCRIIIDNFYQNAASREASYAPGLSFCLPLVCRYGIFGSPNLAPIRMPSEISTTYFNHI